MSILQIRLKNCIQTILDLEPDMRSGIWGRHFDEELSTLREYLQQVDHMSLAEDDVRRLENATASFLAELSCSREGELQKKRLLQ
ncbi:hypothetical protein [uncultured Desulfovibrio sp.]|jgi:hypothetical protein|uniref:hypothetical protein n=1 Tax=uncultured Desulfovibrio sp. TaxID=167968 RepID=UPI00262D5457|nr:hypothetical protein [uncultured Desulfovibrio sp.]